MTPALPVFGSRSTPSRCHGENEDSPHARGLSLAVGASNQTRSLHRFTQQAAGQQYQPPGWRAVAPIRRYSGGTPRNGAGRPGSGSDCCRWRAGWRQWAQRRRSSFIRLAAHTHARQERKASNSRRDTFRSATLVGRPNARSNHPRCTAWQVTAAHGSHCGRWCDLTDRTRDPPLLRQNCRVRRVRTHIDFRRRAGHASFRRGSGTRAPLPLD